MQFLGARIPERLMLYGFGGILFGSEVFESGVLGFKVLGFRVLRV